MNGLSVIFLHLQEITKISDNIYTIDFPAFAICLPVFQWSDRCIVAGNLMKIVEYFCKNSIPHNIFWTLGTHNSERNLVKIFIFPRANLSDKHLATFNIAFCELAGFVPVGGKNKKKRYKETCCTRHF